MIAGEGLSVQLAARVLGVSQGGYYAWRDRPPSARAVRHAWLTEQIQAVHHTSNGIYGARRVHAELRLGHGILVSQNAVEMLMHRAGIKGLPGNRRPRPKHQTPTATDLVDRQFTRSARDQLWVTDITEHPTLNTRREKASSTVRSSSMCIRVGWWAGPSTAPRPPW